MFITLHGIALRVATRLTPWVAAAAIVATVNTAPAQQVGPQPVVQRIQSANEKLNMIASTSRNLTLDHRVPRVEVNNPEIIEVRPLSPTDLQVYAKRAGVTQINLWDENQEIHTIEVIVDADARELTAQLNRQFPNAALKVIPFPNSVMVTGYVDDPRDVSLIIAIAQQYSPQVIDSIRVGGVQQVMLKVRVMEVSRTKLRTLGIDFADLSANSGSFVGNNTSGLLRPAGLLPTNQVITSALTGQPTGVVQVPGSLVSSGGQNFSFGIIDSSTAFVGFLEALRQDDLAKVLAEPVLVTNSGRPAYFSSGGQFPILVPQSLGTVSIQYRTYGTQVDFVPIVLGNGWIRLEVRPSVSEIDPTRSVTMNNIQVPALRVREVDTGVEMQPGQTLAIAGLVQSRVEAQNRGLPFISDLPYIGPLFSRRHEQYNEVELLIFVTPNLAEAMNPQEVPPCGPGMNTTSPTDFQLYAKGHIETPRLCPPGMAPTDFPSSTSMPAGGEPFVPMPEARNQSPTPHNVAPPSGGPPPEAPQPNSQQPVSTQRVLEQPMRQPPMSPPYVESPMTQLPATQPTSMQPTMSEQPAPQQATSVEQPMSQPTMSQAPISQPSTMPPPMTVEAQMTQPPVSQQPMPQSLPSDAPIVPNPDFQQSTPAPAEYPSRAPDVEVNQSMLPRLAPPRGAAIEPKPNESAPRARVRLAAGPLEADAIDATTGAYDTTTMTRMTTATPPSIQPAQADSVTIRPATVGRINTSLQIKTTSPAPSGAPKAQTLPGLHGSVGYDEIK